MRPTRAILLTVALLLCSFSFGGAATEQTAGSAEKSAKRSEHWSLQPLKKPELPRGNFRNPIDAFITEALTKKGLAMSAVSDRRTLIRRLSFDLLGLPPTPEEIDAFLKNRSARAYEELVEHLLASPRY